MSPQIEEFKSAMRAAGINPPDIIVSGKLLRFSTNGRPGDMAGWCRLFPDGQGGVFGDFRSGVSGTWQADKEKPMRAAEYKAFLAQIEFAKRKAEADEKHRQEVTENRSNTIWESFSLAPDSNGYLKRKRLKANALKQYHGPLEIAGMRCDGALIVPIMEPDGKLGSLQFISQDGTKRYLPGYRPKAGCFPIGQPSDTVIVAEGVATGLALFEATALYVVCALDSGHLLPVAKAIRTKYPNAKLIVAADNDIHPDNGKNVGVEAAIATALAVDGLITIPEMSGIKCDFADLWLKHGAEAIWNHIESAKKPLSATKQPPKSCHISAGDHLDWPEPMPLRRELPAAEHFPNDALGSLMSGAALRMREIIQAPDAIIGQSLLAAITLAVQAHADIDVDGRLIPLTDFFATIGESGERKSACDKSALAPHHKRQKFLREQWSGETSYFEADLSAWKKAREEALSNKHKTREDKRIALLAVGDSPTPPIEPLLMTPEPTIEGLVKLLTVGWPSIGLFSDEGAQFLGGHSMSSDNMARSAGALSIMWDGAPIPRTRAGDGNIVLYGRRVALHLMLQPVVAPLLFGNSMLSGQGLTARMLTSWPPSKIGEHRYVEADLSKTLEMQRYFTQITNILEIPLPLRKGTSNELKPRQLSLSPEAKQLYIGFHNHMSNMSKPDNELHVIRAFTAKAAEHSMRLAGLLALADDLQTGDIGKPFIQAGIELTQFYITEMLRLHEMARDKPDLLLAEKVLAWARGRNYQFSLESLYQHGPRAVRNKADASRVLRVLHDHGLARPLPSGTKVDGKPRRNSWEVRP